MAVNIALPRKPENRSSSGFTIIEVMIVLAIAGLILLIVFETIPVLERSGRNNQRKQDVQAILQEISHYELSNSGDIPTQAALRSDLTNYEHLSYYVPSNVYLVPSVLGVTDPTMPSVSNIDKVYIYNHAFCDPNSSGNATNQGAGYNDVVALYALESGTAVTPQCQQL